MIVCERLRVRKGKERGTEIEIEWRKETEG